jgi:hypothetical protein
VLCLTTSVAKASNFRLVVYKELGMMWRKAALPWFEFGVRCTGVFILRLGGFKSYMVLNIKMETGKVGRIEN